MGVLVLAVLVAPSVSAECTIDRLGWMTGSWQAEVDGVVMEEVWTEPRGGMLLGLHRDVKDDRAAFEFLRIAVEGEGIVYWASPSGREATGFTLTSCGEQDAIFENPDNEWPKRLHYWLDDKGSLHAQADGGEGERVSEWVWKKQ